jgi:hypothetical protein
LKRKSVINVKKERTKINKNKQTNTNFGKTKENVL